MIKQQNKCKTHTLDESKLYMTKSIWVLFCKFYFLMFWWSVFLSFLCWRFSTNYFWTAEQMKRNTHNQNWELNSKEFFNRNPNRLRNMIPRVSWDISVRSVWYGFVLADSPQATTDTLRCSDNVIRTVQLLSELYGWEDTGGFDNVEVCSMEWFSICLPAGIAYVSIVMDVRGEIVSWHFLHAWCQPPTFETQQHEIAMMTQGSVWMNVPQAQDVVLVQDNVALTQAVGLLCETSAVSSREIPVERLDAFGWDLSKESQ